MNIKNILMSAAMLTVLSSSALATPWSFGVLGDTQWSGTDLTGNNINTVAVNQINACNAQFVAAGVDFVIQVGDLTDTGSDASLQTRLNANAALNAANIPFYGLRGNHESSAANQTFFQSHYIPTSTASAIINVAPDNTSYSVTYNDTKLVLLDINTSTNTTTLATDTTWMASQLSAADHTQGFVFDHKNLLGQNHKDNAFGSSNDANPTLQNNFLAAVANNNVKYVISGHDHMHYRSEVTSPDGQSKVQEIITASDSYKYYTPSTPVSARDNAISQELGKTGYYIYTVDGPRVSAKYYATTPLANGDVAANPVWTLQETFGYSLNGTQKLVAAGQSFAMNNSIAAGTSFGETGYVGTTMAITTGSNGTTRHTADSVPRLLTKDINTGWTAKESKTLSDILTLTGMDQIGAPNTDKFTLTLSFDGTGLDLTNGSFFLATKDSNGNWVNAIDLDHGSNLGSFVGIASAPTDDSAALGTYGIDTSAGIDKAIAWAVIDHNSEFAVVPEPSTYVFIASGLATLACFRRRRISK